MIQPRPTSHLAAEPFGLYAFTRVVHRHERPSAWCQCGAKLSTYRPIGDESCWACQAAATVDPELLHPPVLVAGERQKRARGW